jgi:hypothetical protein
MLYGSDVLTLEATQSTMYQDQGATCSDAFDGMINNMVSIVGVTFPSLNTPGVYQTTYSCTNSHGVSAAPLTRTVTVQDTTCPVCTLTGSVTAEIEASFPYTDAGATCTDTLNGALMPHEVGLSDINVEHTGTYTITYTATDSTGNTNAGCTHNYNAASHLTVRTVVVMDTLRPVIGLQYAGNTFHVGSANDVGKGGHTNPASGWHPVTNPVPSHVSYMNMNPLMAQVMQTDSGWLVASVVCMVAGVAMLVRAVSKPTDVLAAV